MKLRNVLLTVAISAVTAILSVWGFSKYVTNQQKSAFQDKGNIPANYAGFLNTPGSGPVDFTPAATASVPAVVHITTKTNPKQTNNNLPRRRSILEELMDDDMLNQFFGDGQGRRSGPQAASGSGVIVSEDGFIITNNHVIEGADEINITTSDKKTYKGKIVGADPSTDLAVVKIEGKGFPFLLYGNSDDVKLGQWVLAIGYPLALETTVTAGIVSAKGRMLGLNRRKSQTPIESYIQTDAAVNMGNSGGALINTTGELIGINSAIASPTGSYAGYSYAIPVNLVKKIVNDIMKYGNVQRAYLGISPDEQNFESGGGAYIGEVAKDGAAADANLKKGDIITKINGAPINSWNELQATVASFKVGDKITLTYKRDGKESTASATLKNKVGTYDVVKNDILDKLGAQLETIEAKKAAEYGIDGGVVVKKVDPKGMFAEVGIKPGFVILKVNNQEVGSVEALKSMLSRVNSRSAIVAGVYPGYEGVYQYGLNDLQ
jgi:serine protease Do